MGKQIRVKNAKQKDEFIHMNDYDFVRNIGRRYLDCIESRNAEDFTVNIPQMNKFLEILSFFRKAIQDLDGYIEPFYLDPRAEHGGFTAFFPIVALSGEQISEFCRVLQYASAFSLDGDDGQVIVSFSVPNVYRRKE